MTERLRWGLEYVFDMRPISLEKLSDEAQSEALRELSARRLEQGVLFLEDNEIFPNRRINELMVLAISLFNRSLIGMSLTDRSSVLNIGADSKENGQETVFLLIPRSFAADCQQYPTRQLGLIVKAISYIQDSLNRRLYPLKEAKQRAKAYLAEFLITRQTLPPRLIPDADERDALSSFPKGLDSLPDALFYEPFSLSPTFLASIDPHD